MDNKRLAQSLEQAVLTNRSLHSKLEQARDQYRATMTLRYTVRKQRHDVCVCEQDILRGVTSLHASTVCCRDEELHEAQTKISHLSEELRAEKQQTREDYESSVKTLHREISEVPNGRNISFRYIDFSGKELL